MATHSARFLEGYSEVSRKIVNSGKETVLWKKDGDIYTMDVSLKHGKRDGVARIIGCDGTTMETVTYKKDRLNGICKHYYGSGSIKMKCMVVNGRMEGKFTEYDGSGKVICRGRYVDGERKEDELDGEEAHEDESGDEEAHGDEPQSSNGLGKALAGGTAAAAGTAAATGAFGGAAALLGFGSPGIAAGSAAASMMSAAWTTGIGTGLVSAAQSAGALFMAAAGGSTLAAGAAVAAPLAVGTAVAGGIYYWRNKKNGENKEKDKEDKDTEEKDLLFHSLVSYFSFRLSSLHLSISLSQIRNRNDCRCAMDSNPYPQITLSNFIRLAT